MAKIISTLFQKKFSNKFLTPYNICVFHKCDIFPGLDFAKNVILLHIKTKIYTYSIFLIFYFDN